MSTRYDYCRLLISLLTGFYSSERIDCNHRGGSNAGTSGGRAGSLLSQSAFANYIKFKKEETFANRITSA